MVSLGEDVMKRAADISHSNRRETNFSEKPNLLNTKCQTMENWKSAKGRKCRSCPGLHMNIKEKGRVMAVKRLVCISLA